MVCKYRVHASTAFKLQLHSLPIRYGVPTKRNYELGPTHMGSELRPGRSKRLRRPISTPYLTRPATVSANFRKERIFEF